MARAGALVGLRQQTLVKCLAGPARTIHVGGGATAGHARSVRAAGDRPAWRVVVHRFESRESGVTVGEDGMSRRAMCEMPYASAGPRGFVPRDEWRERARPAVTGLVGYDGGGSGDSGKVLTRVRHAR
jgi:hypothetical protein